MADEYSQFKGLLKSGTQFIKNIWNDMRKEGFKRTLHRDMKDIYQFYLDDETRDRLSEMKWYKRWAYLTGLVLKNMIIKLSPTRRILVLLSILIYFYGRFVTQSNYFHLGFLILLLILILELKDKLLAYDELKEARILQFSMLPETFPKYPDIDIACYMKTANEVSGDYYDFQQMEDGTLIVVIGDATGHGMKSGVVVTAIKSLFSALGANPDISAFFNRCTQILKGMNLEYLYMAMTLIRIKNRILTASVAGMPPILLYKSKSKILNEISKGGTPLGFTECHYQKTDMELEPGDTILLMSDGFPELLNDKEEMLDYHRVKEYFKGVAHHAPKEIIAQLCDAGEKWRNERAQDDDITFVVLQIKQ